jgi:hypothetical protein
LRAFQHDLARTLAKSSVAYRVLDTTLISAIVRVRAWCKGLFAGQGSFERNVFKTEWVYDFKLTLVVDPDDIVSTFGAASAKCGECRSVTPS